MYMQRLCAEYFNSHNQLFKVILGMGVLGLALFALIVGASMYRGYARLRGLDPTQVKEIEATPVDDGRCRGIPCRGLDQSGSGCLSTKLLLLARSRHIVAAHP